MKRRTTVGVMGSAGNVASATPVNTIESLAKDLAEQIVSSGCILVSGETTGIPEMVVREVRNRGGFSIGISPAHDHDEQKSKYQNPEHGSDIVIYTGFGMKGRNVVNIRSSDIVIIFGGSIGTLNELTIAYDEGKIIGVLEGSGGVADLTQELLLKLQKKTKAKIFYGNDPKELFRQCLMAFRGEDYSSEFPKVQG